MYKAITPSLVAVSLFALAGCATYVKETRFATGATHPKAIYVKPFAVSGEFDGWHGNHRGEVPLRESIAPMSFAEALQEQMALMAPSRVLAEDEIPQTGWLIDGELEIVDAGNPVMRGSPYGIFGLGRSTILVHVRVYDFSKFGPADSKAGSALKRGRLVYDFTVTGGTGPWGPIGKIYRPGVGYATPFDYRNVAERVYHVLSTDPHRYGVRSSPTIRY